MVPYQILTSIALKKNKRNVGFMYERESSIIAANSSAIFVSRKCNLFLIGILRWFKKGKFIKKIFWDIKVLDVGNYACGCGDWQTKVDGGRAPSHHYKHYQLLFLNTSSNLIIYLSSFSMFFFLLLEHFIKIYFKNKSNNMLGSFICIYFKNHI